MAREYMRIILMGVPAAILSFAMNFCVQAEGQPLFAMGTQVVGAVSNTILDALFIWGWGWGIAGAAWGTILSQMLSVLWVSSTALFFGKLGYRSGTVEAFKKSSPTSTGDHELLADRSRRW